MDFMQLTQLLGNLGEFVGAIAVVITLAYVARQVRYGRVATEANTKQLAATMSAEMTSQWLTNNNSLANDAELAEIYTQTLSESESISPQSRLRITAWSLAGLKSGEFAFHQWRLGNLDQELWESNRAVLSTMLQQPNNPWRNSWPVLRHMYSKDFQEFVDGLTRPPLTG